MSLISSYYSKIVVQVVETLLIKLEVLGSKHIPFSQYIRKNVATNFDFMTRKL